MALILVCLRVGAILLKMEEQELVQISFKINDVPVKWQVCCDDLNVLIPILGENHITEILVDSTTMHENSQETEELPALSYPRMDRGDCVD